MANGTTRNSLAAIALKREKAGMEKQEEMNILARGHGDKIPLKYSNPHNHSRPSNKLNTTPRKGSAAK